MCYHYRSMKGEYGVKCIIIYAAKHQVYYIARVSILCSTKGNKNTLSKQKFTYLSNEAYPMEKINIPNTSIKINISKFEFNKSMYV